MGNGKQNFYCQDCHKQFQFDCQYLSFQYLDNGLKHKLNQTFKGVYENVILDEFWSWVGKRKTGKRWVWYAYCADSGKILAFQIGKRNDATCKKLFKKLEKLTIHHYYTDDWKSYKKFSPVEKHTVSKKKTRNIERQNLNFRTHLKRLCRKTICFSKKDDMHFGFIKAYIWLKNTS